MRRKRGITCGNYITRVQKINKLKSSKTLEYTLQKIPLNSMNE